MEFFRKLFHLLFGGLNDTARWNDMIQYVGTVNIYVVLFLIVFAETGLVVTPFLPGDSLLFAVGAIGARHEIALNLPVMTVLLIVAAVLGDAVNYWVGYKLGPAVFTRDDSKLLNRKHLIKAQEFYEKYGGKTIILARFVPIVRTFAPFVAGIGRMNYFRFALYNVIGGIAWVVICISAGYYFGRFVPIVRTFAPFVAGIGRMNYFRFALYNVIGGIAWVVICISAGYYFGRFAFVQKHFELVILMIIFISLVPMAWELWMARRAARKGGDPLLAATTIGERAGNE